MPVRLMGIETEYAIAAPANGAARRSAAALGSMLICMARKRLPHVSGAGVQNMFLANGSRFYLDCGRHPEFCTPEVDNPSDCVRYVLAGEAILRDLVMELRETMTSASALTLSKTNVDYQPGVTWGCHENYLHRAAPASLPRQLKPHLVTRIYACAGGLNPFSPGIEFSLSPRLHVFSKSTRECTIRDGEIPPVRGIYNPRDRPLCSGGYHRLHVVCADSVSSQQALWLRVATTSVVLVMAEAGLNPGGDVALRTPVAALQTYLTDPHFRATAQLKNGQRVTAINIQRHYLKQAEAHLEHRCMPPFAPLACEHWRAMLDRLEQGPDVVADTLDWALKRVLYLDHIRRRGFDPEALPRWNHVLARVRNVDSTHAKTSPFNAAVVLDSRSYAEERRRLEPCLRKHGLSWDQLRPLLALREELCEIDIRFGQVAPEGIFHSLEPVLDHQAPGVERIDEAKTTPPQGTRAGLRGAYIRKLAGKPGFLADWHLILNERGRALNLDDPVAKKARWETPRRISWPLCAIDNSLEQVYAEYERGDFERAWRILKPSLRRRGRGRARPTGLCLSYLSWIQSRRGYFQEAIQALDEHVARSGRDDDVVRDYIVACSFQALGPSDPRRREWIQRGDALLERGRCCDMTRSELLGHKGHILARAGPPHEAVRVLRCACGIAEIEDSHPRMRARIMAQLGDALRILGERDEAAHWLDRAELIHRQHDFPGERADYVLTLRAKLERDTERARALLKEARHIQVLLSNYVGLVRTLLLDARVTSTKSTATRRRKAIMELRERVPDLRTCPRLKQILNRWDEWVRGESCGRKGDFFWLV